MVVYKRGITDYDSGRTALFEDIPFDAGNNDAGFAGDSLSCGYVHGGMGAFFYASKYFACGGRRDVDDGDCHYIYVGFSDRYSVLL